MNQKHKEILLKIVELYIENGLPVSSKQLIKEYNLDVSSATIRNVMSKLEFEGFLEKTHVSSGRIPSNIGYKFFAEHSETKQNEILEIKLRDIFSKRHLSIDSTLDEAARAINQIIGLTLVTSTNIDTETLKSIQFVEIADPNAATIVLVTSSGNVTSKIIQIENMSMNLNDIKVAIRLFKERLLDTPLKDLSKKALTLKQILSKSIKNYEIVLQTFVGNVFEFEIKNHIYGKSHIIKHEGIDRESLLKILELIEHHSIWNIIEGKIGEEETLKIDVRSDNVSLISKKIVLNKTTKEISVIGSNRMDYKSAKSAINLLENFLNFNSVDFEKENSKKEN